MRNNICATLCAFIFVLCSSGAFADSAVENYAKAHLHLLRAQALQLQSAITMSKDPSITAEQKFDLIGQPAFAATDESLKQFGFTVKTYYQFEQMRKADIENWLLDHIAVASDIDLAQFEYDLLIAEYEELSQSSN